MKKKNLRWMCLGLLLCLCLQWAAMPVLALPDGDGLEIIETEPEVTEPEPTEPEVTEPEPTQPEPTEPAYHDPALDFDIPDDYRREALEFAVRSGILNGVGGRNLDENGPITRAQLAAVLTRLLELTGRPDNLRFQDVHPKDWYYDAIAAAVDAGILKGTSRTTMDPNGNVTRQQACAMFSRALGIVSFDGDGFKRFSDSARIADYARDPVSALVETGGVMGYPQGDFRPDAPITRGDAMVILYRLVDTIAETPEEIPAAGNVLYLGDTPLPQGLTLDGSLLIRNLPEVEAEDWNISGQLTLLGPRSCTLTRAQIGRLVSGGDCVIASEQALGEVCFLGTGGTLQADARKVKLSTAGTVLVRGNCGEVRLLQGKGRFLGTVETLTMSDGTAARVDGRVELAHVHGNGLLTGSGRAGTVIKYDRGRITLPWDMLDDRYDYALEGVSVKLTGPGTLTQKKQTATFTATFTGGIFSGAGTSGGKRTCTLTWYVNGKAVRTEENFLLYPGAKSTYSRTYDLSKVDAVEDRIQVTLTYGGQKVTKTVTVKADPDKVDYFRALSTVKTALPEVAVLKRCNLYSSGAMTDVIGRMKAGDTLYLEMNLDNGIYRVRTADGKLGYVYESCAKISSKACADGTKDYSRSTKEGFVDQMGYSSDTDYLVWVSKQTQKVMVFQGREGAWKLKATYRCATGANTTTTPNGTYAIQEREPKWWFSSYYVKNVSIFYGGYAFHSVLYDYDDVLLDGTLGRPASHGCIRMTIADAGEIYKLPMGTAVVIY